MPLKKNLCRVLCAAALTCLMIPGVSAAQDDPIIILHTNDVHCQVEQVLNLDGTSSAIGYAGVSACLSELEAKYGKDRVLLVDAGDAIQGGPMGTLTDGGYIVDIMNHLGYDLAVPGNHEFDYGTDKFLSLAEQRADYPYLSANFTDLTTGAAVFEGYRLFSFGDVEVAFVGVTTPETITSSTPASFRNEAGEFIYDFRQGDQGAQLYAAVQSCVDSARAEGADFVIAVAHLGDNPASAPWTSENLIANTRGIDGVIDGHSHSAGTKTVTAPDGRQVVLTQTGSKLANLGMITIQPTTGQLTAELISSYSHRDLDTATYLNTLQGEFDALMDQVVAQSQVDLTTLDPDTGVRAVRSRETNLGDLCADAYRTVLGADVAMANGGGIRADLPAGEITYEQIMNIYPFGNELCVVEVTGEQLLQGLEMSAMKLPGENGGFLQVSGLTYTINTSVPTPVVLDQNGQFVRLNGENRVTEVLVNGEPLEPEKTYTLAASDYLLLEGGDGMTMFRSCKVVQKGGMLDNAALIRYITHHLGGVIGQEYANPRGSGRITVIDGAGKDPSTTQNPAVETPATYTVASGDSLWAIAARVLGSGQRWQEIYLLNQDTLSDPSRIYIGQSLKLPA